MGYHLIYMTQLAAPVNHSLVVVGHLHPVLIEALVTGYSAVNRAHHIQGQEIAQEV